MSAKSIVGLFLLVGIALAMVGYSYFGGGEEPSIDGKPDVSAVESPTLPRRAPKRSPEQKDEPHTAAAESRAAESTAGAAVAAEKIFGIVEDESGRALDGVEVFMQRIDGVDKLPNLTRRFRAIFEDIVAVERAISGDGGKIRLGVTPSGRYDVLLSSKTHAVRTFRDVFFRSGSSDGPLRFVLRKGFEVKGRVEVATAMALDRLRVVGIPGGESESEFVHPTRIFATCDTSGNFTMTGVPEGKLAFGVVGQGLPWTIAKGVSIPAEKGLVEIELDGRALLFGRVTDENSQPIAGAEVSVAFEEKSFAMATTTTSTDGRYEMHAMPGSRIEVALVEAKGFASAAVLKERENRANLRLSEGKNERNFVLSRGKRILGVVVARGDRQPIAGARVSAIQAASIYGNVPSAISGADGTFAIEGVGNGKTIVAATKDGWMDDLPFAKKVKFLERKSTDDKAPPAGYLEIGAQDPPTVTIELSPLPIFSGRVTDADGRAVVGARVLAKSADGDDRKREQIMNLDQSVGDAAKVTDQDGNFAVSSMIAPEASAVVTVEAPGFLKTTTEPIEPNARQNIAIVLRRGAVIEGNVLSEGRPVVGAAVEWRNTNDPTDWENLDRFDGRTDANGKFRLTLVEPGMVDVRATADGLATAMERGLEVKEEIAATVTLDMKPSIPISGRVVDHEGNGVANARVFADHVSLITSEKSLILPDPVRTDEDGRFEFVGISPRNFYLTAVRSDGATSRRRMVVPGEKDVVLQILQRLSIKGEVRHKGRPLRKVEITVIPDDPELPTPQVQCTSKSDGSFELKGVPIGSHTVHAQASPTEKDQAALMPTRVEKIHAGATGVVIELAEGISISGTARRADGASIDGLTVSLATYRDPKIPESQVRQNRITKSAEIQDGRFTFTGLTPDRYVLSLTIRDYAQKKIEVTAPAENVEIVVGGGCRIRGRVAAKELLFGAKTHYLKLTGDGPKYMFLCADDGGFAIEGITPGHYKLEVPTMNQPGTIVREIDIPESGVIDLGDLLPTQ